MDWGSRKCSGIGQGKKCSFQWNVQDFELSIDERIESPKFSTPLLPDAYWYLEILLVSPEKLKELKISLHRVSGLDSKMVVVNIQFDVSCSGIETTKTIIGTEFDWMNRFHDESNSVTVRFDRKLNNYWLKINCVLIPSYFLRNTLFHLGVDRRLSANILYLLKSGLFYDTVLCAGSEGFSREFKVHQAILHARAPALLKVETSDFRRAIKKIRIPYISADVIEEVLHYAYSGKARTYLSRINIYESAANIFNLTDLRNQLSWRDFPKADTCWVHHLESFLWTLKDFFWNQNGSRNFSLKKEIYYLSERATITISCRSEFVEVNGERLVLESEFTSSSILHQSIKLSYYCRLRCNDPEKEQKFSVKFEHLLTSSVTRRKKTLFQSNRLFPKRHELVLGGNTLEIDFDVRLSKGKIYSKTRHENTQRLKFSECPSCDRMSSDLMKLYLSPECSDVKITCKNGKQFSAHKAILAARHQTFRKDLEENRDLLTITTKYEENELLKLLFSLYSAVMKCDK
ncbi:hypothetical protein TNIN_99441 [Trichonephila inaurata madagascariensis]|uniref:BTB domain-containing protein n=1 Tax=Trichonephila inaurata madagascariensis TaxID=2747483 RepID=A0A8X7CUX7_9ARAC|nr:hypothetical protein TNIN_99441 [Trichonephila inaurata madagascariensis]